MVNYIMVMLGAFLFTLSGHAFFKDSSKLQEFNWNGIEVVWIDEPDLPSYDIVFYFAEGALGDRPQKSGETFLSLSLMNAGTRRYKREEIADNLEYFGSSYGANVMHEYSTYRVSGLNKDISPTMMKICHLFNEANFPDEEIKKEKKRLITSLNQMVQDEEALANRAFRMISLKNTPFARPADGDLSSINSISSTDLLNRLKFLTEKVKKKIYVNASLKMVKELESIIVNNCRFTGSKKDFIRTVSMSDTKISGPEIHLVTVPKSDKVEVRIGRTLNSADLNNPELAELSAGYLGGGFTSRLMAELRKKRGLVYGVYSFAAFQKYYGRAAIVTSTKKDQLQELLTATQMIIEDAQKGMIEDRDFLRVRNYLIGSYPFKFEHGLSYLNQLIFLDHTGKDYDEIKKFKKVVEKFNKSDVQLKLKEIFDWKDQIIFILGEKELVQMLSAYGKVHLHSYESFL